MKKKDTDCLSPAERGLFHIMKLYYVKYVYSLPCMKDGLVGMKEEKGDKGD